MNSQIASQTPQILLAQVVSGSLDIRIVILVAAAVVSSAYMFTKAFLPEIVATVVFSPIIEEPLFRLGLLEMFFFVMFGMELWMCFVIVTIIFMAVHPFLCKADGLVDRFLRVSDATCIGVACGAWYCMNLDEKYYNVLMIVFACVLIHAGFNLLIWILRKVPLIPIHIPVRIVLGLLYLYQFIQVQSWSYRQILIPFFLHRFFIK